MELHIPNDIEVAIALKIKSREYASLSEALISLVRIGLKNKYERGVDRLSYICPPFSNDELAKEKWLPILNFSKYQISDLGRAKKISTNKLCTISTQTDGYGFVSINRDDGANKQIVVQRLVAQAFLENPAGKPQVNHIDGNKKNNRLSNLEYVTEHENSRHSVESGLRRKGGQHWRAKLTEGDVLKLINELASGEYSTNQLANKYAVTTTAICGIRDGKYWKHIPRPKKLLSH